MDQVEKSSQKNLFIGLLTLILEFKISKFEQEEDKAKEVQSSLENTYKHVEVLKEMSTVVFFEYSLIRAAFQFSSQNVDTSSFKDLLNAYKHYKSYRKFRRR